MREEWRPVPGLTCWASNEGRISFGSPGAGATFGSPNSGGYLIVHVNSYPYRVNRLVCSAFKGPPPTTAHHAAHLDGNKTNNKESNLAWKTPKENTDDREKHGNILRGERHGCAKLTVIDVDNIRRRVNGGETISAVARDYPNMSRKAVANAYNRKTWQ